MKNIKYLMLFIIIFLLICNLRIPSISEIIVVLAKNHYYNFFYSSTKFSFTAPISDILKVRQAKNIIEISAYKIEVGDDDIVRAKVKDHAIVNLKFAVEMTDTLQKITPDGSRPLLIDLGKINYITKEARDHFKGEKRKPTAPAVALVANTSLSVLIGNFYLRLNKPKLPTKLFINENSAVKWLKKFL